MRKDRIENRINEYERTISPSCSNDDINAAQFRLTDGIKLSTVCYVWAVGTVLYRARSIPAKDYQKLSNWTKQSFWEVPTHFVKSPGRLNKPGESIFYLSNEYSQTLSGIRYNGKDILVVSRFQVTTEFPSIFIGQLPKFDQSGLSYQDWIDGSRVAGYISKRFSIQVMPGNEHLYTETRPLADNFYDLPYEVSKARTFPAVANPSALNVAFKKGIPRHYLRFLGAAVYNPVVDQYPGQHLEFDNHYQLQSH